MKQVRPVSGANLADFAEALNDAYAELSRFDIERTKEVSEFEALIYYDIPEELETGGAAVADPDFVIRFDDDGPRDQAVTIRLMMSREDGRFCCECKNYDWGRGCPYASGHVPQMTEACPMFNVIIERGC